MTINHRSGAVGARAASLQAGPLRWRATLQIAGSKLAGAQQRR
jgi:hypothetical protein